MTNNDTRDIPDIVADALDVAIGVDRYHGVKRSERYLIAGTAGCDLLSVEKYLTGKPMYPSTAQRIQKAAAKLGITIPQRLKMY